jgi:hypothetical protein
MSRAGPCPQAAARTALSVPLRYARAGSSLARAALAGAARFEALRHYPAGDLVDARSGHRLYYHAHRLDEPEHGHFHLFASAGATGSPVHLVALSLDTAGQPLRWFTTNRWVTGGRWLDAGRVQALLQGFELRTRGRLAPVAAWIVAMVALFADELAALLRARDAALAPRLQGLSRRQADAVLEDRSLELLSECPALLAPKILQLGG